MSLDDLKARIRAIGSKYKNREERARRVFVEERASSLSADRDREFAIRRKISKYFRIPYTSVAFTGSAQIGFSIHKDRLFSPGVSDLDVGCVNSELFQEAWVDIIDSTRSFSDLSLFGYADPSKIALFKENIVRRGMILIDAMPQSALSRKWRSFQEELSRENTEVFKRVTIAVYMNEFAFCWKQDSSLSLLMRSV